MIRNLAAHISGRKHSGKISNKEWILVDSQDGGGEEEQEESLQLPEPVAAVEVFFNIQDVLDKFRTFSNQH